MSKGYRYRDLAPDREDGTSSWVHTALVLTGRMGEIHPAFLIPVWALLAWFAAVPWSGLRGWAMLATALPVVVDWVVLACLPVAHRSWGPVAPPLAGLTVVHCAVVATAGLVSRSPGAVVVASVINLGVTVTAWYATWLEPFLIQVTRESFGLHEPDGPAIARVLHITDIHFEGHSPRENQLVELARDLAPDAIVLTGDYLNLSSVYDPEAQQGVRQVLSRLTAPDGVYAVTGSPVVDIPDTVPAIFDGLPIRWLQDDVVEVDLGGRRVQLVGLRNTYTESRDAAALRALTANLDKKATRVLLHHTPDLAPLAAELGIDLYLCGHTHGGQIRLPIFGAIATSSRWGKRFEQGRYQVGEMVLYVCRGLGLEGLGAPRARFLAPPEIVLWEIGVPQSGPD